MASLRTRLTEPRPCLAAGAHNALSAKLVEEAGFDAVWASGFEISASHAVPDANILTMDDTLEAARRMAEAVSIPVIADCDAGYGNAVNVVRLVREFERAGVAGICIEDNTFPKRCSFYAGVRRELASIEEHAGKVRAAVETRDSPDFTVIARTEALIAGWGLEEALARARAYARAGADLILVHSKSTDISELRAFCKRWDGPTPLVAVPTMYAEASADELYTLGFRLVIFANHALRGAIRAMQEVLVTLHRERRAAAVDDAIVSLAEVERIVGVTELQRQESSYLPSGAASVRAVILAAGADRGLLPLTAERPKCMLDVKGRTILDRQIAVLNSFGIKEIAVVRGYHKQAIDVPNVRYFDNDAYETTGEVASLLCAREFLKAPLLILYGDILFEREVLEKLLRSPASITIAADRAWTEHRGREARPSPPDLVRLEAAPPPGPYHVSLDGPVRVVEVARGISPEQADAEFAGMLLCDEEGLGRLLAACEAAEQRRDARFHEASTFAEAALTDLLGELLACGAPVHAVEIHKGWMEVDSFDDYRQMWAETRR